MAFKIPQVNILGGTYSSGNFFPAVTGKGNSTVEAYVQFRVTKAGVFSGLSTHCDTANGSGSSTITFRKNGADTSLTVTYATSESGIKQDNSNSVSVSVGDLVCLSLTTTAGSIGLSATSVLFEADSGDTVQFLMASNTITYTFNNLTRYFAPTGDIYVNLNLENYAYNKIRNIVTVSDLSIYVSANTRSTTNTLRFRKNTANGSQVVAVTAGTTGLVRDTTHTDSLAIDDLFNTQIVSGSGGGNFTIINIQMTLSSTVTNKFTILGSSTWVRSTTSSDIYGHIWGGLGSPANPENSHVCVPDNTFKISKFSLYVSDNTGNRDIDVYLRGDFSTLNSNFTIPSGTSGWFEDSTDSDNVTPTLKLSFLSSNPLTTGSGNITVRSVSALAEFPQTLRIIMS